MQWTFGCLLMLTICASVPSRSVECVLFFFLIPSLMTSRPIVTYPPRQALTSIQFPAEVERAEVMKFTWGHTRVRNAQRYESCDNREQMFLFLFNSSYHPSWLSDHFVFCRRFKPSLSVVFLYDRLVERAFISVSAGVSCKVILQEVCAGWRRSGVC